VGRAGPGFFKLALRVLSLIKPQLVKRAEPMWLDVDINHGPSYGSTLFWNEKQRPVPGSRQVEVQLDLDYKQFVDSFITLLKRPTAAVGVV
jgi:purine nucleosidase